MMGVPQRVSTLVSTKWLADKLTSKQAQLRVLDGSWHMPFTKRDQKDEFTTKGHIPGAQFFDIEGCITPSPYEHMAPDAQQFEQYVGKLGIGNQTHVVVYDNNDTFGLFSAQRVWWTFRLFGHKDVSILDGGLKKWIKDGYDITKEVDQVPTLTFKAKFEASLVKSFEDIQKNISEKSFTVMDARAAGRFKGTAPEPRPDIKPGHLPGSVNIPFMDLLDPESKCIKPPEQLKAVFDKAGVDLNQPLAATCGSGITACMIAFAADRCGKQDVAVYDGSWVEWFGRAKPEHIVSAAEPEDAK